MRLLIVILALTIPHIASADSRDDYYEISADLNGDGINDYMISDPVHTFGNAGGRFHIHLGVTAGGSTNVGWIFMHPLAANLTISEPGKGTLAVYVRGGQSGNLVTYSVTMHGIEEITSIPLSPNASGIREDQELYERHFGPEVRLKAIKRNPQHAPPAGRGEAPRP